MARLAASLRGALVIGLALTWELSSAYGVVNPRLLPRLSEILTAMAGFWTDADIAGNILLTLLTIAISFLLSAVLGLALGIAIVASKPMRDVVHGPLFFLFGIPKSVFLPIFILSFGIGMDQKIIFGIFTSVFFVTISVVAAFDDIPQNYLMVSRSFGASRMQKIAHVYAPSLRPQLVETARIALIFNIMGVLVSEMYASRMGIGHYIASWGENFQITELLAGILTVSAFAIAFNELLRWLENRWTYT